ncbi:MAG: TlpA disulfide reductase family protein [Pyrinomonadaceae bacterium]
MKLPATYRIFVLVALFCAFVSLTFAQPAAPRPPREIFRDSYGNQMSNNEFVDIRMANFHLRDATVVTTLDDGTIEFRLQKVPQEGMAAPDFTAKTIDGKTLRSAELKGKVIVLNFWFIGCPACIREEPKLNDLRAKFVDREDVIFLAMTADTADSVKKYIAKERFDYTHAPDAEQAMKAFVFSGYPKNIVIGRDGIIRYWRSPVRAWDKFESVVRTELAKI